MSNHVIRKALAVVCLSAVGVFGAGCSSSGGGSAAPSAPVRSGAASGSLSPLARCAAHVWDTADFGGAACAGFAEDDVRLAPVFEQVTRRMAACVNAEIEQGVRCNYGSDEQQLAAYAWAENGGSNV